MKRHLRRALSLLCVLAMCIGLLPSTALAAGQSGGGQEKAYFYIHTGEGNQPANYTFAGTGAVDTSHYNNNSNPAYEAGYVTLPRKTGKETHTSDAAESSVTVERFPKITHEGVIYVYKEKANDEEANLYTVDWQAVKKVDAGYNIYHEGKNYAFSGPSWHVDGEAVFLTKKTVDCKRVLFEGSEDKYGDPEEVSFKTVSAYVDENGSILVPEMPEIDGNTYYPKNGSPTLYYLFEGWYSDAGCTREIQEENAVLNSTNEEAGKDVTIYAKYVAEPIYFFISLPSNSVTLSGDSKDYRYLTRGGAVKIGVTPDAVMNAEGIRNDEKAILDKVAHWPTGAELGWQEGSDPFKPSSASASGRWTIAGDGKVTPFQINVDNEEYTDAKYAIRWAKMSYTATQGADYKRYHIDGVLYKKKTVNDVLKGLYKQVKNEKLSLNENGEKLQSETFSFKLEKLVAENGSVDSSFTAIDLTATVTSGFFQSVAIRLPPNSVVTEMTLDPGYYQIRELLEGEQAKSWKTPNTIRFALATDGTVTVSDGEDTITNELRTYRLTYDGNSDDGSVANVPTDSTDYQYNQYATVAGAPTREGYCFKGWSIEKNGVLLDDDKIQMKKDTTLYAIWTKDSDGPMPAGTVTIRPANITIYTGGEPYGGITDASGNIIVETDSGLPEPGYHLKLSDDVIDWLNEKINIEGEEDGPRILADYLTFTYSVGRVTRVWDLSYVGVYDVDEETGEPTRYVYSLEPGVDENGEEIPVRLLFKDESGEVAYDDIIGMAENSVCEEYTMSINPGTLTQSEIKAVFTVPGEDPLTCGIAIQPGTLTIRSTTDEEYVNDIGANADGILADGNVTYYVNDSGVTVDENRVGLLVDQVSNSDSFNQEMAQDAMDHAIDSSATDWTHRSDLSYEMAYLDLVDTGNGHAVVTMDGNLTIYWPMPHDADRRGDFHVVHYTEMDREGIVAEEDLDGAAKEIVTGEAVRIDGRWYVAFDADSFSPFVLVYEAEDDDDDRPRPPRPDDDDEDEPDVEEPDETPVDDGLNREDHYAYLAGYTDGTIRPEGNITRAEVATIFFRLMTDEYREDCWSTSSGFTDVTAANWYNNAISTTAQAGWIAGYEDGSFRPDAYITRAEFATIAARFLSEGYAGGHRFNDIQGHWAAEYIDRAAAAGWIGGYEDGSFRPNAYITRAEVATLVNRMLDRAPDVGHLLPDMVRWPDNPETAWYYADIQEATNSHDYTWAGTGAFEVWTELLPNRDWAALEEIWSQANDAPGGEVMD